MSLPGAVSPKSCSSLLHVDIPGFGPICRSVMTSPLQPIDRYRNQNLHVGSGEVLATCSLANELGTGPSCRPELIPHHAVREARAWQLLVLPELDEHVCAHPKTLQLAYCRMRELTLSDLPVLPLRCGSYTSPAVALGRCHRWTLCGIATPS